MNPQHMIFYAILGLLLLNACSSTIPTLQLSGATMGTRYQIQLVQAPADLDLAQLKTDIQARLDDINAKMSTYQADSELSKINRNPSTDWIEISPELHTVLAEAQRISHLTQGAFDVTVKPLVELWGFGADYRVQRVPEAQEIAALRERVGYEKLSLRNEPPALRKTHPQLNIDLSAIAKGYAVDQLAALLDAQQVQHYLVDIGGEVRAKGQNARSTAWQIGIEKPQNAAPEALQSVSLENAALATSGDYRNYFAEGGKRYSHLIDPILGQAVTHHLASVSVRHAQCMTADAWATALLVMGTEAALKLAAQEQLAVVLIERLPQTGRFRVLDEGFLPHHKD